MDGLLSSCSSVLLLGEGNFSFARSLSQKLAGDVRVVATSFESWETVCRRRNGREHVEALTARGVTCLFEIDATKVHTCQSLEGQSFDGIIFNFPHVPGKANIAKNRDLLKNFFQSCVQRLSPTGRILVTLCNGQGGTPVDSPQREIQNSWQVVAMATYGDLILTQAIPFCAGEYQEYDSTGYRGQDKGFLTQRAVTHVFERSRAIQEFQTKETFAANSDGGNTRYHCPKDLAAFMKRNLLSDKSHPISLLNTILVSTIQKHFPCVEVLQECNYANIVPVKQESGCSGVYTVQEVVNIHEASNPTEELTLRPHLLCHLDNLIDRYANKGCVLPGRSYHRCVISPDVFPIMHQLLLALPHSDAGVTDVVTKVIQDLHGNKSQLHVKTRNTVKDMKNGSHDGVGETEEVKSLKRKHSDIENSEEIAKDSEMMQNCDQCSVCLEGRLTNELSIQLVDTSGNQTTVGVCGTVDKPSTSYDIILLYLDHLIMHLLHIHDIRLLWSTDTQMWDDYKRAFSENKNHSDVVESGGLLTEIELTLRSKYPPLYIRDVSFWIPTKDQFDELRFMSVLRQASCLLLQQAWLKDVYHDDVRGDVSRCYRLEYLSCDQALSKDKLARIHQRVLELIREEMGLIAR